MWEVHIPENTPPWALEMKEQHNPFMQTTVHSESLSTALFWKPNMPQLGMESEITALFLPQHAPYLSLSFQKTEYH